MLSPKDQHRDEMQRGVHGQHKFLLISRRPALEASRRTKTAKKRRKLVSTHESTHGWTISLLVRLKGTANGEASSAPWYSRERLPSASNLLEDVLQRGLVIWRDVLLGQPALASTLLTHPMA